MKEVGPTGVAWGVGGRSDPTWVLGTGVLTLQHPNPTLAPWGGG